MADKKISDLTALTGPNTAIGDKLEIADADAGESKSITLEELFHSIHTVVTTTLAASASATGDLFLVLDITDTNDPAKVMTRAELAKAVVTELFSSDITTLTDSSGGTADNTIAAVSGSGDDTTINNNFADLAAKVNAFLAIINANNPS